MSEFIDGNLIGAPNVQADYWELQNYSDNCATTAEGSIINQFGYNFTQDEYAYISAANGWYNPGGGTSPEDVGKMMDLFEIPNHTVENAGVADLINELQQGHGVIVGVKADQLWDSSSVFTDLKNFILEKTGLDSSDFTPADHAIVVTGIDFSDASNPMVLINDSGEPNGQGHPYPLARFVEAWENSNFYYTATDTPLPSMLAQNGNNSISFDWGSLSNGFDVMSQDFLEPFNAFKNDDFVRSI